MSNIPISGMTAAESIGNNDIIPIVQSGVNKKATGAQIKEYASAGKQNSTDNNLDTNNKTIVGAINEVRNYNNLINKPTIPTVNVDRVFTSWGTSLNVPFFRQHYLIFVGNNVYNLWIAGANFNDMNLTLINTNTTISGQEKVTNGALTCKRTTSGISITLSTNYTITVIG
jgi:hypothetical protein